MFPSPAPLLTTRSGRVKEARKLARRSVRTERGLFLAEGSKAVREALLLPGCVREVFADSAPAVADPSYGGLRERCLDAGATWSPCDPDALAALADTVTPQGVVAVCRTVDRPLADVLGRVTRLVVVCADVRDPGNAGTVLRCADAAGAEAVVLAGQAVDPHNPKTVRATVGSLFHLPVALAADPAEVVAQVRAAGLQVLAADGAGEVDLDDAADSGLLEAPTAWLFGNEAHGLPDALAGLADARLRIPIHGRAESLNLATAAAVCLYASARAQRGSARSSPAGSVDA